MGNIVEHSKNHWIEIESFSFCYPNEEKPALHQINLSVDKGDFLVFFGKSGCGKSTLFSQFKTVLTPHGKKSGKIYLEGHNIEEIPLKEQSERIGYVAQNPDSQIVTDKVFHEMAFAMESLSYDTSEIRKRVAEMSSYFGITDWFYKEVNELSGGQKQLLNLAAVMTLCPDVLILDEPTSQLDPIAAADFIATVHKINRDFGTTVLMSEHRLEEVFPIADRIVYMENGTIGAVSDAKKMGSVLSFGEQSHISLLPVSMQLALSLREEAIETEDADNPISIPVTVREGREWFDTICRKYSISKENVAAFGEVMDNDNNHNLKQRECVLELTHISFRYERKGADVLRDVNLRLHKGECYALVGGNGTGKTTTLSVAAGMLLPYEGKVTIFGRNLKKYSKQELYRDGIGVLPQDPTTLFVKSTVQEELEEMLFSNRFEGIDDAEIMDAIAKLTQISALLDRHPYDLSGGEKQRLALAKLLLLRPGILLMDEPTKGMDGEYKRCFADILEQLKREGISILMITHDIEFAAEYADVCGLMFDGEIVSEGTPREVFSRNYFYTTTANRISRDYVKDAVTKKDVIEWIRKNKADF